MPSYKKETISIIIARVAASSILLRYFKMFHKDVPPSFLKLVAKWATKYATVMREEVTIIMTQLFYYK
jgi:hypothetical protein